MTIVRRPILKRKEKKNEKKKKQKEKNKRKGLEKKRRHRLVFALRKFGLFAKVFKDMEDELKIDYEQFMSWVEQTMKRYGSAIPVPKFLSKGKRSQITRLVKEAGSKKLLEEAIVNMAKSDILNGRVRRRDFPKGFLGSLPWLLANDERIFDVANGKFDNPPEQPLTAAELRAQAEEERRLREEQRREESRRIEAEERERKRRERDAMFAGAVHGEELEKIWAQISLPPLEKPNDEKKLRNRPP